ncbi:glycosyltransferase [Rhodoferax fermentans]|uniref:glycosyltransferase n=1 Tax=Rhodoferax fermentans TaxID=28066 RepID=UPI0019048BB4
MSVIMVVRNDPIGFVRTMASVATQDYCNFQLIVIDGASTDNTLELLRQNVSRISLWLSETDIGIYHAMNKGVAMADGEWLLFMNAGDEFADVGALSAAVAATALEVDVVYSDWIYREDRKLAKADLARMNVRHQSVLYRKSLHEVYGLYLVGRGVTISDFIFFLSIAGKQWVYCAHPISICDRAGASGQPNHFHQRMAVELLFGRRSRIAVAAILLLHPLYRFVKCNVLGQR